MTLFKEKRKSIFVFNRETCTGERSITPSYFKKNLKNMPSP